MRVGDGLRTTCGRHRVVKWGDGGVGGVLSSFKVFQAVTIDAIKVDGMEKSSAVCIVLTCYTTHSPTGTIFQCLSTC